MTVVSRKSFTGSEHRGMLIVVESGEQIDNCEY